MILQFIINFHFLPKTLLIRDRNPLLFVSFSRLTCQKDKCYFRVKSCTITESTINYFFFNSTSSISIKNYKTRNYKNTSYVYHITLCLLSLDGRWRHNKKVEQTKMNDVQSAKRGLKNISNMFLSKRNHSMDIW